LDSPPRAYPAIVLGSIVAVLLAGSAGFLLWWLTHPSVQDDAVRAPPPSGTDVDRVEIGPVDHAPGTVVDERRRVDELVDAVVFGKGTKASDSPDPTFAALVGQGVLAVPRLLDAFHRLHAEDAFAAPESRARAAIVDRALRQIRRALPPSPQPAGVALRGREEAVVVERRAKAWFHWWRTRSAATPPLR
jgi:hypothetical protein